MARNKVQFDAELNNKVSGPLGKISKDFDRVTQSKGGSALLQGVGLGAGIGAANLLAGAVGGVTDAAFDAIRNASDLNETITKSQQIFGDNADDMEAWADTASTSFGQSKRAALDAASGFAGLFQTVGIELDQATEMSQKITELGADLASFYNADVSEALAALRSGLSGESEPLRRFNVFLSETAVQSKAMALGITKTKGPLTEQQKQLARYAIIMEQTSKAQGDFERTSDGLANTQRTLAAQFEDLSASIGQELLPIAVDLASTLRDDVVPALKEAFRIFQQLTPEVDEFGNRVEPAKTELEQLDQVLRDFRPDKFGQWLRDQITGWDEYGALLESAKNPAEDQIVITDRLSGEMRDMAQSTGLANDALSDVAAATSDALRPLTDLRREAEKAEQKFRDFADAVLDAAVAAGQARYGPAQLEGQLATLEQQVADDQAELNKLNALKVTTPEQRRQIEILEGKIASARAEMLNTRVELALLNGTGLDALIAETARLAAKGGSAAAQFRELNRQLRIAAALRLPSYFPTSGPGQSGFASGVASAPPGWHWVGEKGPELRAFRGGETVLSHPESMRVVSETSGGGAGSVVIQFNSTWPPTSQQAKEVAELVNRELSYTYRRSAGPQSE